MADLPIWSDNERIDSEAVLLSVWAWIRAYPVIGLTLLGYSFAIVHRRRHGEPDVDLPCKIRECNDENCQKCAEEAGGYDFRWMHFAWFRLFGNSSGWHVVYRRSLARTSSVSRLSKLRDGQYETAMVLSRSRNWCAGSGREIWRPDGIVHCFWMPRVSLSCGRISAWRCRCPASVVIQLCLQNAWAEFDPVHDFEEADVANHRIPPCASATIHFVGFDWKPNSFSAKHHTNAQMLSCTTS